jgi:hypothetical protein
MFFLMMIDGDDGDCVSDVNQCIALGIPSVFAQRAARLLAVVSLVASEG